MRWRKIEFYIVRMSNAIDFTETANQRGRDFLRICLVQVLEMIFNRNEKLNIYHSTQMSKDRGEMVKIKLIISIKENRISHEPQHSLIIGLAFCKWTSSLISPFIQLERIGKFNFFDILTGFQRKFNVEKKM